MLVIAGVVEDPLFGQRELKSRFLDSAESSALRMILLRSK
jgi:hypothetical protein